MSIKSQKIKLTQGKYALVDDEDFTYLNQWKWCYHQGYAQRNSPYVNGKRTIIHMSRVVNQTPEGYQTDHSNGNKLDNRKTNLRTCTSSQNNSNRDKCKNNKTGFKGVFWDSERNNYKVTIKVNGKTNYLGRFTDLQKATLTYNKASLNYQGKFGRLNNI